MQAHTPIGKVPIRLLHVAPETVVAQQLQALPLVHYVSGDLVHRASVHMDICRMPFRDNSFDVVYCSHVLNMLPDDKPAMADLFRVLSPGGLALLQVPKPLEGPGIEVGAGSSAPERRALLGDPDMYRRYGKDMLAGRLLQAGFEHQVVDWFHSFRDREQRRMGLIDEPLQVCIKPHSS
jgi:SAM-dependent methyltransferase